jgi:hypothetical protein
MEGRQFRRGGFAPWGLLATCGILAALASPSAWAGSPAQDQYGSALPGGGGRSGNGGGGGGPTQLRVEPPGQKLGAMSTGDVLRFPGGVTVRAFGVTPGRHQRLFRLGVAGGQKRTIVGIGPARRAISAARVGSADSASGGADGGGGSWPLAWVLLLFALPVAIASAAFLAYRRSGSGGTARG